MKPTLKMWSISTTVRNPERIPGFCLSVSAIEGKEWNKNTQQEFMHDLIRRRLYSPTKMTNSQQERFDNPEYELSLKEAKEIFDTQKYVDPPMRGRTALSPLQDVGVVRTSNKVELTELGKGLLNGKIELQDVLLNYCLKWELPTPEHSKFSAKNGFNIRPFIGSLALISRVNELWAREGFEPVGLSREEFEIFAPTLISFKNVDLFASRIVESRKQRNSRSSAADKLAAVKRVYSAHLAWCLKSGKVSQTDRNNLEDFGDNAIRYFRQTGFIEYRGAGRYVDIATAAVPQAKMLVDGEYFVPKGFDNRDEYLDFVADLNSFTPPWSEKLRLLDVKKHLRNVLKESGVAVEIAKAGTVGVVNKIRGEDKEILELREMLRKTRLSQLREKSRQSAFLDELVAEYGQLLTRNYVGYLPKPVALEFNTFKTFLSLNDATSVVPNYPVGDDGEPISTAPGGATDLICEYKDFVLSVEVTLSRGNNQWVMEGQPVQRHLRSIELEFSKPAYALFLAPKLHADTVETFWVANLHGYQGDKQRIVPLEISVWCEYLRSKKDVLVNNTFVRSDLKSFLDKALPRAEVHHSSTQWKQMINSDKFILSC